MVFANLKRVIHCACFKSPGSRKGTPKCNLRILAVAQHLPRKWLISSSSLQRGHNGSLTLRIIVRCRLRVLCPVRRYTSVLRPRRHCRKAICVSPGVTWVTSSLACRQSHKTTHELHSFDIGLVAVPKLFHISLVYSHTSTYCSYCVQCFHNKFHQSQPLDTSKSKLKTHCFTTDFSVWHTCHNAPPIQPLRWCLILHKSVTF